MARDLYRGLLGGVESALAWGRAEKARRGVKPPRPAQPPTQAIETWEEEGGALSPVTKRGAQGRARRGISLSALNPVCVR